MVEIHIIDDYYNDVLLKFKSKSDAEAFTRCYLEKVSNVSEIRLYVSVAKKENKNK